MNKLTISTAAVLVSFAAFSEASINNVIVRQQWPWSGKVNIDFVLSDPADGVHDVEVSLKNGQTGITIASGSLLGQTEELKRGQHRLVWDPSVGATSETPKLYSDFTAEISLVDTSKKYLIVDFGGSQGAGAQSESYTVSFTNAVPADGWFADNTYKDQKMVLRWIPAGSFVMGSPVTDPGRNSVYETQKPITLTKGFYIGVVPATGYHYLNVMGEFPNELAVGKYDAVSRIAYTTLRGENAHTSAVWPNVEEGSYFGKLNAKAPVDAVLPGYRFDLPSAAQLEYAARAGTTTTWYNGTNYDPSCETDEYKYEANLVKIGVYYYNAGIYTTPAPTKYYKNVGVLEPNAWGLYNIVGTIDVLIRDLIPFSASGTMIDATPKTGVDCVFVWKDDLAYCWRKGGNGKSAPSGCRVSQWRTANEPWNHNVGDVHCAGFRIVCTYFGD